MFDAYFQNKVVAITGGSDGIGKAMVGQLLAAGARVATCARNADKLYKLQVEHVSEPLLTMVADVSNESDCKLFIDAIIKNFGRIDILINNAGISMRALFAEADVEILRKLMEVNFWGSVYTTKYALPYLLDSKGDIAAISSIAGYRGLPGRTGYSASKFALQGWMEALRTELLDSGVNVLWICPGFTESNIRRAALKADGSLLDENFPLDEKLMSTEVCAQEVLLAIAKKSRNKELTFKGKFTVFVNRLMPRFVDRQVHKYYFKDGELVK
jgi:short-subunit dehydrogenase